MKRVLLVLLVGVVFLITACGCGDEYAPVCDSFGMTHQNLCYAQAENAHIAYEGVCLEETEEIEEEIAEEIEEEVDCSSEDQYEMAYCVEQRAKEKEDKIYCEQLDNDDKRNLCLAKVTEDSDYCHRVWHPGLRDACLLDFALLEDDVQICLKIQELMNRYGCVDRISENTYDKSVCEYIDKKISIGPINFYEECIEREGPEGFELIE